MPRVAGYHAGMTPASFAVNLDNPVLLLFGGFIVLFAVVAIIGYIQAKRRRKAMKKLARSLGLLFHPGRDHRMDDRFGAFSCLHKGSRRYAFNVLHGTYHERQLLAFDYHYETYSTGSKGQRRTNHHYFSAVIIDVGLPLKPLFIRPEGFFDKVTEFFGYDDIDFELNEFSRQFYVKAEDKKWAFDVIHQSTMEFLLGVPKFKLQFAGSFVIAYRGSRFGIEDFHQAIGVIEGIVERFPDYLVRELRGVG
jgi:hypothetical protein